MGFLDSLDSAVGSATGVRGSVALSATIAPVTSGVIAPIAEAFAPSDPTAPPAPSNPARTVQKVAGAALAAINAPVEMMNNGFAMATAGIAAMFPTMPAATIGSLYVAPPHGHLHPPSLTPPVTVPIPLPSLGPVVLGTCIKVLIGGMPAARAGDIGMAITCVGICPAFEIFMGSSKVFIGGMRAARMTDMAKACTPSIAGAVRGIAAGMAAAGQITALAGVIADSMDGATGADPAIAAASGMAASMGAAQMAADAATMAITAAMGVDTAVPPAFGMITVGNPVVQIGGFPMINFPNPAHLLFGKIKAMRAKKKAAADAAAAAGCKTCP